MSLRRRWSLPIARYAIFRCTQQIHLDNILVAIRDGNNFQAQCVPQIEEEASRICQVVVPTHLHLCDRRIIDHNWNSIVAIELHNDLIEFQL